MIKFSIIMPVYNSEKFLSKSIMSVLEQTYDNFELIIIDDNSKGKCPEICSKFANRDRRISVIKNNSNLGICKARNIGLSVAKGEYIGFCDDDDIWDHNLLEDNLIIINKYKPDIIKFNRKLIDIYNGKTIRNSTMNLQFKEYLSSNDIKNDFYTLRKSNVLINIWNGLYKSELFNKHNIRFNTFMRFGSEDEFMSLEILKYSNSIIINDETYYTHFRRREHSTSSRFNLNKIDSLVKVAELENEIWASISDIDKEPKQLICLNRYIVNILTVQLFHENCDLKFKEKINVLKKIRRNNIYKLNLNHKVMINMFILEKKQFAFAYLFYKKHFYLLYLFSYIYYKLICDQWR